MQKKLGSKLRLRHEIGAAGEPEKIREPSSFSYLERNEQPERSSSQQDPRQTLPGTCSLVLYIFHPVVSVPMAWTASIESHGAARTTEKWAVGFDSREMKSLITFAQISTTCIILADICLIVGKIVSCCPTVTGTHTRTDLFKHSFAKRI